MFLRNVGIYQQVHTVLQPKSRRQLFSVSKYLTTSWSTALLQRLIGAQPAPCRFIALRSRYFPHYLQFTVHLFS
jgi:hypothetical protein